GDDCRRSTPVEEIIHTDTDDAAFRLDREMRESGGAANGAPHKVFRQIAKTGGLLGEFVVEIFDLGGPIRSKHPFKAAASRPADGRRRQPAAAEDGRIPECVRGHKADAGGGAAPSETAGAIGQQAWCKEVAVAAA